MKTKMPATDWYHCIETSIVLMKVLMLNATRAQRKMETSPMLIGLI